MSFLDFNLDDEEYQSSGGDFDPLPAGWYTVKVNSMEMTDTKAGTGKYIKTRFDVTGPTHEGRVLFTNINTHNPNSQAQQIGRGQLRQLRDAVGLTGTPDPQQFIGRDVAVKVTVKDDPQYGPGNEVKGFRAVDGSQPPMPSAAPSASAASSSAPPWASK